MSDCRDGPKRERKNMAETLSEEQARAILRDRGTRFLDFLSHVAQTVGVKTPRRIERSEKYILSTQIPQMPGTITVGPATSGAPWLTVRQVGKPTPVHVPKGLQQFIEPRSISKTSGNPTLNKQYDALADKEQADSVQFSAVESHAAQIRKWFDSWKREVWTEWVRQTRIQEQAYDLYQTLFDLHLRLEEESEYLELLFGHCIITWTGRSAIDYPIVFTKMRMTFDEDEGTITVEPDGFSYMSLAAFENSDLPGLQKLERFKNRFDEDPIDVWDPLDYPELEDAILTQSGSAIELAEGLDLTPGEAPRLQSGWALMLRKRTDNRGRFYQQLAKKLQETDQLPVAFDSIFSNSSTIEAAIGQQDEDDAPDHRLLMPLPTNAEQRRIARQIMDHAGVTVQGPPGTGKSHTIVNLIAHLLSQGKRILVTAEKDQALTVLQDKLPEQIRSLAVAPIGDTSKDMERLRISIQQMQGALSYLDVDETRRRIAQLNRDIDRDEARLNEIDGSLEQALATESSVYPAPQGELPAFKTARWVRENADIDIIPDNLETGCISPVSPAEFAEYVELCQELDEKDVQESSLILPEAGKLPTGAQLHEAYEQLDELSDTVEELQESGLNMEAIDRLPFEQTQWILDRITEACDRLAKVDGEWEKELGDSVRLNQSQRSWLRDNVKALESQIDECMALSVSQRGHVVEAPNGSIQTQTALIEQWRDRADRGKGLPRVFNRKLREFAVEVSVDGYLPQTGEQLDIVADFIRQRQLLTQIALLWQQTFTNTPVPSVMVDAGNLPQTSDLLHKVDDILEWWDVSSHEVSGLLRPFFPGSNPVQDLDRLKRCHAVLSRSAARKREQSLRTWIDAVKEQVAEQDTVGGSSLWRTLAFALDGKRFDEWDRALEEGHRLIGIRERAERWKTLHSRLSAVMPQWAERIAQSHGDPSARGMPENYQTAFELAKARTWVRNIARNSDLRALLEESYTVGRRLRANTVEVVSLSSRLHLKENQRPDDRRALQIWLDAIKKYGKGTGRHAARFLLTARRELPKAMNAMPVWIMPLHKVMENFDPTVSEPFDVIIVDESSQCDLLSVGVLALADKAIIVGDDQQTSPAAVGVNTDKITELQNTFLSDFDERSLFTMDESLYSICGRAFSEKSVLREHFRCVPEIIEFCNRYYGDQIFPLRERSHPAIGSPLQRRYIEGAPSTKFGSDNVNVKEAQALVDQVKACCEDPRYDGMTFGVVTMMSGKQRDIIMDLLVEALGPEEYAKRRLRVGNPPAFQGDERNIIFLSYITDASGRTLAWTRKWNEQWMNVAVSRAKDQLWVFHSMEPSALSGVDVRRELLEYIDDHAGTEVPADGPLSATVTEFERDVCRRLMDFGYGPYLRPHYQVGRYDIDCVVDIGGGLRLAIECDGDEPDMPIDYTTEIVKQRVLERLGWTVVRLGAPAYYLDPEKTLEPVRRRLSELMEQRKDLGNESSHVEDEPVTPVVTVSQTPESSSPTVEAIEKVSGDEGSDDGMSLDDVPFGEITVDDVDIADIDLPDDDPIDEDQLFFDDLFSDDESAVMDTAVTDTVVTDETAVGPTPAQNPDPARMPIPETVSVAEIELFDHEDANAATETGQPEDIEDSVAAMPLQEEPERTVVAVPTTRRGYIRFPGGGRIAYADPLASKDFPNPSAYASMAEWTMAAVRRCVAYEYPMLKWSLYERLQDILQDKQSNEVDVKSLRSDIDASLETLTADASIVKMADKHYLPLRIEGEFYIIRGRGITDISVLELSAVMYAIISAAPVTKKTDLYERMRNAYGFGGTNRKIEKTFDDALKQLEKDGWTATEGDLIRGESGYRTDFMPPARFFAEYLEKNYAASGTDSTGVPTSIDEDVQQEDAPFDSRRDAARLLDVRLPSAGKSDSQTAVSSAVTQPVNSSATAYSAAKSNRYGERYGLQYEKQVSYQSIPRRSDFPTVEQWVSYCVVYLVSLEFPLAYSKLRAQMLPHLNKAGMNDKMADNALREALRINRNEIVELEPGFYCPSGWKKSAWCLIQGRKIEQVSIRELEFVMLCVIESRPIVTRSFVYNETAAIYGFVDFSANVKSAFESALNRLASERRIVVKGDLIQAKTRVGGQ